MKKMIYIPLVKTHHQCAVTSFKEYAFIDFNKNLVSRYKRKAYAHEIDHQLMCSGVTVELKHKAIQRFSER